MQDVPVDTAGSGKRNGAANPDALIGAPEPTVGYAELDDVEVYYEVRGSGDSVLIIGAADEDAEVYRGVAERLAQTNKVVTYDRRGTRRSGSKGWPTSSRGHADDAAALITTLGLPNVTVFGASAGGIVALALALRHPENLATTLCYEPGIFSATGSGMTLRDEVETAVREYLRTHPQDWSGASAELGRAAVKSLPDTESLFDAPPMAQWFAQRTGENAEALIRGDLALTGESFDLYDIANSQVNVRFAYGTASHPVFREIAFELAATRGDQPDSIAGMSHLSFLKPGLAADYIRKWL